MINRIKESPWNTAYIVFHIAVFIAIFFVPAPIFYGIVIGVLVALAYDTLQTKAHNERKKQNDSVG